MKFLFLLISLLLLSGCNPLWQGQLKPSPPPTNYGSVTTGETVQMQQQWWLDFNNPQLNRLQQQLFSNNLNLRQALYRLQQLEALQQISGASLWPQLNLNGSYNRDHAPGLLEDTDTTSRRISVAAGYEIDLWHKLGDKKIAARLRHEAGQKDVQALLLSLSAQLTEQYFVAVEQRGQLKLLQQQSGHHTELLRTITDRYRAGLATAGEVYQAQQNLALIASRIPPHQTALTRAENGIALLLGKLPGSIAIDSAELPQLTAVVNIGLPADLLLQRPDVAAALLQLEAADREYAAALAALLPAINLSATLGKSATHLAIGDIEGTIWNLALGLTQPLIDGGRRKAESKRQQAVRAEKLAAYQQTLLTAVQEVETALVAETQSINLGDRIETRREINAKSLQFIEDSYRYGLIDSKDLLLNQINHLEISTQQLSNQRQQLSDRITLVRALGGSWMATEINRQQQTLNQDGNK